MYTPQFAAAPLGGGLQRMHEFRTSHQWSSALVVKHTSNVFYCGQLPVLLLLQQRVATNTARSPPSNRFLGIKMCHNTASLDFRRVLLSL